MSDQTNTSEVVIIGGGIYGASLAYQLAVAGKTVTLLEAGEIACGASGGPGERGVRANGRDMRELPICALSQELWRVYQEEFEGGVGYRRTAVSRFTISLWSPRARGGGSHGGHGGRPDGPRRTLGGSRRANRRWSASLNWRRAMIGAIYCPKDGVGDHTFATRQFAAQAAKAGAEIRTGAKVEQIVHSKRAATGVKLESGEIVPVGERLVMVANAGAQELLKPILKPHELGPIWNLMPQMLYVSNPLNKKVNHLLSHAHRRLAVKQIPDGTLMLSGGAHVAYTPEGLWKGSLSALTQNVTDAIRPCRSSTTPLC